MKKQQFPIEDSLPRLRETLLSSPSVVLSAPPGAGKTTRVPVALLDEPWMNGKRLIMLEPRRLAARRAAQFMSSTLGESVGQTIGYRIRGESKISRSTRIEVVTEGVLTRLLHENPDLPGIALLVFDEFHERSIHADLGLALSLDVQENLRPDLKLLIMSATLDGVAVADLLGNAPVVTSEGRSFPVETRYLQFPLEGQIERNVVEVIRRALNEAEGDLLVFLPGQREIRRVEVLLGDLRLDDIVVRLLFGEASDTVQHLAFAGVPDAKRKVILSTSIAETSLTIDGVRVVIDSGLARGPRFDPRRGMSGLVTMPVSKATADQRRGRAGRQQPGICYRLWTEKQHEELQSFPIPEIQVADLASFTLDLARWGADVSSLRFLQRPPAANLSQARSLLHGLGATDEKGALTPHGREMSRIPIHPRLSHMLLQAKSMRLGGLACDVAALLEESDILRGERHVDVDLASRLDALRTGKGSDESTRRRVLAESKRLRGLLGVTGSSDEDDVSMGVLMALAYPERIGKRRGHEQRRYQLASGSGAILPDRSMLRTHEFLAISDVDGVGAEAKIFLAAPLEKADMLNAFADSIVVKDEVIWNEVDESVTARRVTMLGSLVVAQERMNDGNEEVARAFVDGIRKMGLGCLPWDRETESIRSRSEWLRRQRIVQEDWPELSDSHLLETLDRWLTPFIDGMSRRSHLSKLDLAAVVRSIFSHRQLKDLDRLAPVALVAPTGSRVRVDYASDSPVLAVKLQEMFGQTDTPTVAGGKVPVAIHLLSPAGRPLAVTQDLRSFWLNVYPGVRKEMRGRYPKHPWPEDPMSAPPTRRTKQRSSGTK